MRSPSWTVSRDCSLCLIPSSVGVRQQSSVTWRSQVVGGRPRGLFHPVTFWEPSRTSQAMVRMALARTVSGIRAIWPNSRKRRRQTTDSRDSWPEADRRSTLRMKSDHLVPSIRRWQRMWNASSLRHPMDVSDHVCSHTVTRISWCESAVAWTFQFQFQCVKSAALLRKHSL